MPEQPSVHVAVPSELEHLELVHAVSEQVGRYAGLDEQACLDLGLAVREAVANGMTHGNGLESALPVEVAFRLRPASLRVEVRDRGEGFDPAEVQDPTLPENLCRSSGRGLLLMRSFVDDVRIRGRRGGGTVVVMSKTLAPSNGVGDADAKANAAPPSGRRPV